MLSQHCREGLQKFGVLVQDLHELTSGVKLADAVNNIFYQGSHQIFQSKIIRQNQQRKGNNVINMNIILKQIQKDQNIQCPPQIKSLTSFSMTEDPEKLSQFVEWLIQTSDKSKNSELKEEAPFEDVYFGVNISPSKNQDPINLQTDKVVKKGSFKIIRPKSQGKQITEESPKELKEKKIIENEDDDLSPRKTVIKMTEKPPMPNMNKQRTKQHKQKTQSGLTSKILQTPAPFSSDRKSIEYQSSEKNHQLFEFESLQKKNQLLQQQLMNLSQQLDKEQKVQGPQTESRRRSSTQHKKLFKIDIDQVMEWQKRQIVQWLIISSLLNYDAKNQIEDLHQIFKNGIIFPEIVNRHKGRGADLSYFKNPKRSAEINANYQKVFNFMKEIPAFNSELAFHYEYFVPEVHEKAFWSLLKSLFKCFSKKMQTTQSIYLKESQVSSKPKRSQSFNNFPKKISQSDKKDIVDIEKIKFNNTSTKEKKKMEKIMSKPSIQFIKQIPDNYFKHEDLVQKQEPLECGISSNGYRQLHEIKRNYVANTPKKRSANQNSMTKSRIIPTNSMKKSNEKMTVPSVNLEMEMKALKYLREKKITSFFEREDKELFKDPVRNGVLINEILQKQIDNNLNYFKKPKNIADCRQNFKVALKTMKKEITELPQAYEHHTQQIIKGEISLFYGLLWHIVSHKNVDHTVVHGITEKINVQSDNTEENILMWIRMLEQNNPEICKLRIRDHKILQNSITNSNLLYTIAATIIPQKYLLKPTYDQPVNFVEQQANLRKILSFLMQNKVLKNDYVWKIKNIVKKDRYIINNLMNDLMSYDMSKHSHNEDSQRVTFMKYMRKNSNQPRQFERLQTTMANQSFGNPIEQRYQEQRAQIQVGWMRKLGFDGDLSLNNGVILCHLIGKLTMQSMVGVKQKPQSKAECLSNIRKAIKNISKFKWDEQDILEADRQTTLEIYKFVKDKFKHSYALKSIF